MLRTITVAAGAAVVASGAAVAADVPGNATTRASLPINRTI